MQPASLTGTVQDSKAKRQERLKSRFRDRGGIFVPSEGNPLVDILLARGINGDSPVKRRSPRKAALTPKPPRPAASRVTQTTTPTRSPTKTPLTGARKSAARQRRPPRNDGKENCPPRTRKSRNTSKGQKQLQEDRRRDEMNTGTSAGRTWPRTPAPERIPFADQLANAINAAKSPSVAPPRPTSGKMKALVGGSGDDSDVLLANKALRHGYAPAGARTKLTLAKEEAPQPSKKRRSKAKAPGPANDPSDTTENPSTTTKASKKKEKTVVDFPYPPITHEVDSGGGRKVQVLQEKTPPTNTSRKRKQRIKSAKDESEPTQGPPRKKSRRADAATSHSKKNKETSRSACEVAKVAMDKPLPSPVKQPAAGQKPASKAKRPLRAGATNAPRPRGPPPAVLRRIKINAQNLPALSEVDDDDPINFLG